MEKELTKREQLHEKLINKERDAYCNLFEALNQKQHTLFNRYMLAHDRLRKHEFADLLALFKSKYQTQKNPRR